MIYCSSLYLFFEKTVGTFKVMVQLLKEVIICWIYFGWERCQRQAAHAEGKWGTDVVILGKWVTDVVVLTTTIVLIIRVEYA